jgi:2-deoxy-D-gluconate 3-dehydrogenase
MNAFDLSGKVAIVTGGNGGIGLGMAKGLAGAGATVVIAGRNAAKGAAAVRDVGGSGTFLSADISKKADCQALVRQTAEKFGRLDILVNNAGTIIRRLPHEYAEAEWHEVMDANLTSAFLCCQAVYPHLSKAGGGKIINIGSMMSLFGAPHTAAYGASKGGMVQFTRAIATAWGKDNIQANAVLPGFIVTDLTRERKENVPGLDAEIVARTPAGRWGFPEDLAGIAVFLASSASDFVTGAAIPCDGGYSIRG